MALDYILLSSYASQQRRLSYIHVAIVTDVIYTDVTSEKELVYQHWNHIIQMQRSMNGWALNPLGYKRGQLLEPSFRL